MPPDLPLEAIAEEVKHSWRLKVWYQPSLCRSCFLLHVSQGFTALMLCRRCKLSSCLSAPLQNRSDPG